MPWITTMWHMKSKVVEPLESEEIFGLDFSDCHQSCAIQSFTQYSRNHPILKHMLVSV